MTKTNGNDLAYPTNHIDPDGRFEPHFHNGLTKREAMAMAAMQGMYSNSGIVDQWDCENIMAENAVKAADALIKALNEPTK